MDMHRLLSLAAVAAGVCVSATASADRSVITVTPAGHELKVVISGVTDYCSSDAATQVIRSGDSIRIIRERPFRVSRCLDRRDVVLVVKDVPAGIYRVTYEQVPLVAPARALTLASTTAIVRD